MIANKKLPQASTLQTETYTLSVNSNRHNRYSFDRDIRTIIQHIPMAKGAIKIGARKLSNEQYEDVVNLSSSRNVRATFLALKMQDFLINSEHKDFLIVISK